MTKKQTRMIIVILLGFFGVHKFMEKNTTMGLVYLFTGGICGIGWIIDVVISIIEVINENNSIKTNLVQQSNIINDNNSKTTNLAQPNNIINTKPNGKDKIYDKMVEVTYTHTEGRQKLIKQLIKEDEFLRGQDFFHEDLICCDADLEDGEMPSGKKCINVVVKRDGCKYADHLGYITDAEEEELHKRIKEAFGYSTDIYVSTEDDGKYSLKVRIQMYKNIE